MCGWGLRIGVTPPTPTQGWADEKPAPVTSLLVRPSPDPASATDSTGSPSEIDAKVLLTRALPWDPSSSGHQNSKGPQVDKAGEGIVQLRAAAFRKEGERRREKKP